MKRLYVVWQDEDTRRWHPVGMLTRSGSNFQFVYTEGAKLASGFIPFGRMTDLSKVYQSEELFPLFANRILSRSRPEYDSFARWISADLDPNNPMLLLARTGGSRFTDSLMIYEKPEPNERNEFDLVFLCHGIRYFPREAIARIDTLAEGENLLPMFDPLNPADTGAVALRTDDPASLIGYVPRFFARDIRTCIEQNDPGQISLRALRVNRDAPLQFRLLCHFSSPWPKGFESCSDPEYKPLATVGPKLPKLATG